MSDPSPLIVANFKANKTWEEVALWVKEVGEKTESFPGTIVVCPSFPFITALSQVVNSKGYKIKIAAQDISQFEQGAYTGEVAASQMVKECTHVIIGHSERRQNLSETEEMLSKKVENAKSANIEPIFCVQSKETLIPNGINIVAYEPVFAIGTGNPDTPQNAQEVAKVIKENQNITVLYGGSVNKENINSFIGANINGVLVGTASLNPQDFLELIKSSI